MRFHRAGLGDLRAACSRVALALAVGLGLAMTGCVGDTSTPKGTIQTVAYDAAHGKYDDFKATLTGDALARYGNPAGMEDLRANVGKVLSIGAPRLVSRSDQGNSFESEVAALTPQGAPVAATVDTVCSMQTETYHDPGSTGVCMPDPSNPDLPDVCEPDTPPSDSEIEVQSCLVSGIALHAP
ncbi:MAG TPA: hypothetical protein VJA16_13210 [Thermoanaerobaculia bacterium]